MHRLILAPLATLALIGAVPAHAAASSGAWGTKPVVAFTRPTTGEREIAATTVAPRFGTKPVLWNAPVRARFVAVQARPAARDFGEKAALWTIRGH